jgi:type I restriction enzyme S subunit
MRKGKKSNGKPMLQDFEKTASPIFRRILTNTEESRTLAALRDVLLPRLLSGELRVKDAKKLTWGY